jgi:hypothetical protein
MVQLDEGSLSREGDLVCIMTQESVVVVAMLTHIQ